MNKKTNQIEKPDHDLYKILDLLLKNINPETESNSQLKKDVFQSSTDVIISILYVLLSQKNYYLITYHFIIKLLQQYSTTNPFCIKIFQYIFIKLKNMMKQLSITLSFKFLDLFELQYIYYQSLYPIDTLYHLEQLWSENQIFGGKNLIFGGKK